MFTRFRFISRFYLLAATLCMVSTQTATNMICAAEDDLKTEQISFDSQIRPLLSDRCYACHGPDANSRAADLRLDQEEAAHQQAIVPGEPEESELWLRITSDDPDLQMPPTDSHKAAFSDEEKSVIKQWIIEGARYESFWAFVPPVSPTIPRNVPEAWSQNPIDAFVWKQLSDKGLAPQRQADPRTLIRRLSLDLTGLPPTPEEVKQFAEQVDALGFDVAWEKAIDRLLASPRYGEHIGRYWLDLVRYADTNGMHKDFYRNHFAYRDWVIRSFNQDAGYDHFVRDQLAGDLYEAPTKDQLTATAFHRLHLIIDQGTALPEESFHKNVIDRVTSVGTAFMGLTVQCAQCHDHKYDPISQKDFYSLYAFFNNIDAAPETVAFPKNGLQPPFISLADEKQKAQLATLDQSIQQIDQLIKQTEQEIATFKANAEAQASNDSADQDQDSQQDALESLQKKLKQLQQQKKKAQQERTQLDREVPYAMVMKERTEVRPTYVKIRGQYDTDGEEVQRSTPSFLPPMDKVGDTASRLDLANWLTNPQHPLTGRVAVNRVWQQLFGVGLVKTSEDFGAQGETPSHPKLLDFLTTSFVANQWKFKPLIKSIAMSQTYQQSSSVASEAYQSDPENRNLARGSRYRMDAEMLRDLILQTSGQLVNQTGGPSVKPPQPPGLWKAVTMINERYQADQGDDIHRRSVYTYWKRGLPPPQMTILNAPTRDACIARRERTNTPSQALLLLNEPEYMKAARLLAVAVLKQPEQQRMQFAWETITSQVIAPEEQEPLETLLQDLKTYYQQHPDLAQEACDGLTIPDPLDATDVAAWTVVINTLYNLDITKNRN